MNPIFAGGISIGVLVAAWTFVFGFTGWYRDPTMASTFIGVATVIEIVVLLWALRKTAAQGRTYSGQVVAGTMIAVIGGAMVFCGSLLFTTVVFRDAIEGTQSALSPLQNALSGFLGTFMTGVVATAIIAVWIRARGPVKA